MDEVRKAVEMGYGLVGVLEFWEYKVTCFDRDTNSGGFFAEYVNMFVKLKQQSSGYPSWVQSKADKAKYIEARRGNCFGQGVDFKKFGAKNFGKIKIKFNVG